MTSSTVNGAETVGPTMHMSFDEILTKHYREEEEEIDKYLEQQLEKLSKDDLVPMDLTSLQVQPPNSKIYITLIDYMAKYQLQPWQWMTDFETEHEYHDEQLNVEDWIYPEAIGNMRKVQLIVKRNGTKMKARYLSRSAADRLEVSADFGERIADNHYQNKSYQQYLVSLGVKFPD